MEENNNSNPYDSSEEVKELEALQTEIAELENNIEGNGAAFLAQNISPEEEELFFENKEEFFKTIMKKLNNFFEEQIGEKTQRLAQIKNTIDEKNSNAEFYTAQQEFEKKHKDVSVEELMEFAQESLPPKTQRELAKLPLEEAMEEIYMLWKKEKDSTTQELPKQTDGEVDVSSINTKQNETYFDRV